MIFWAIFLFAVVVIAGVLGFGMIFETAFLQAKIIFFIALGLLIYSLVDTFVQRRRLPMD